MDEDALSAALAARFAGHRRLTLGVGDDAAVWSADEPQAITQDLLVDGVHFLWRASDAEEIGRRALAVNLSDLAAMGARPRLVSVAVGLPAGLGGEAVLGLYDGMTPLLEEFDIAVSGGDVTRADRLIVSVTAIGEAPRFVGRGGGRPGDVLCVTGDLGGAAAGLRSVRGDGPEDDGAEARFRRPAARVREGIALREAGATAMIDLSDGLGADLPRLSRASGTGFELRAAALPLGPGASWRDALEGGDDYELLVALPPGRVGAAAAAVAPTPLTAVGSLGAPGREVFLDPGDRPLARGDVRGHDHLR